MTSPSALGFLFTDAREIDRNMALVSTSQSKSDTSWTQPFGEWKTIRDNRNELVVRLRETKNLNREMVVTFRIFDDGVGFRYSFPDHPNLHNADFAKELTQFALAEDGTAWWKPTSEWNREEYLHNKTRSARSARRRPSSPPSWRAARTSRSTRRRWLIIRR